MAIALTSSATPAKITLVYLEPIFVRLSSDYLVSYTQKYEIQNHHDSKYSYSAIEPNSHVKPIRLTTIQNDL